MIVGSGAYYDTPGGRQLSREPMGMGAAGGGTSEVEGMDLDRRERPREVEAVTEKVNISSKLQTIDYSHGSSFTNLKSVDYNHGSVAGTHPPEFRDPHYPPPIGRQPAYPHAYEGYQYPPGGGGYPPGPPGPFFPSGIDAATLFAAYASQTGTTCTQIIQLMCPANVLNF